MDHGILERELRHWTEMATVLVSKGYGSQKFHDQPLQYWLDKLADPSSHRMSLMFATAAVECCAAIACREYLGIQQLEFVVRFHVHVDAASAQQAETAAERRASA